MSLSSKLRKENDESFASKQSHSTQGLAPEQGLTQLNDIQRDNDLPSRQMHVNDTNVADDYDDVKLLADETRKEGTSNEGPSDAEIKESQRASWGQPPLPADAEDASTDEDSPMTAYQQPANESNSTVVTETVVHRTTSEGGLAPNRADEPDRTFGHS